MPHTNQRTRFFHYRFFPAGHLLALALLSAFSSRPAQAGIHFYDPLTGTAALLGPGSIATSTYPLGTPFTLGPANNPGPVYGSLASPFSVAAGANTLTFSASGSGVGAFVNEPNTANPTRPYEIGSDHVLETVEADNLTPTGPLEIDFQNGVTGFGLQVEDFGAFFESFTVTAYDGASILGAPFTTPILDSTGPDPGRSLFLGGQTTDGDVVTKLVISSTATLTADPATDSGYANDFVFGPVTVGTPGTPVPEASTAVSGGLGLLLFGCLLAGRRLRKREKSGS